MQSRKRSREEYAVAFQKHFLSSTDAVIDGTDIPIDPGIPNKELFSVEPRHLLSLVYQPLWMIKKVLH